MPAERDEKITTQSRIMVPRSRTLPELLRVRVATAMKISEAIQITYRTFQTIERDMLAPMELCSPRYYPVWIQRPYLTG